MKGRWSPNTFPSTRKIVELLFIVGYILIVLLQLNNHEQNLWFGFFVADKMTLHIPDVALEPEVNELCSSPETVEKLEQCVMNWQTSITVVLEEQQHKKPQVCGSAMFRVSQMAWLTKL